MAGDYKVWAGGAVIFCCVKKIAGYPFGLLSRLEGNANE
jgi:hypothetical protein